MKIVSHSTSDISRLQGELGTEVLPYTESAIGGNSFVLIVPSWFDFANLDGLSPAPSAVVREIVNGEVAYARWTGRRFATSSRPDVTSTQMILGFSRSRCLRA